jgi:hypothetical protein
LYIRDWWGQTVLHTILIRKTAGYGGDRKSKAYKKSTTLTP